MRTPTTNIGLAVSNRPDSDLKNAIRAQWTTRKEYSDRTMPETIQTYHPTFEKAKKLFNLRKRLWEIADGKSDGTISYEEANHLAVDAVATTNGGMPRATSGPWYDSASFAPTVGFVKRQTRWAWFTRTWTARNGGANIETIAVKRKGRQRFERQRIRQGRHKQNSHSGTPIRQGYGYHQPSDSKVANHFGR